MLLDISYDEMLVKQATTRLVMVEKKPQKTTTMAGPTVTEVLARMAANAPRRGAPEPEVREWVARGVENVQKASFERLVRATPQFIVS